jgi:hypothetical protein
MRALAHAAQVRGMNRKFLAAVDAGDLHACIVGRSARQVKRSDWLAALNLEL